jgi:hypothetical protein
VASGPQREQGSRASRIVRAAAVKLLHSSDDDRESLERWVACALCVEVILVTIILQLARLRSFRRYNLRVSALLRA